MLVTRLLLLVRRLVRARCAALFSTLLAACGGQFDRAAPQPLGAGAVPVVVREVSADPAVRAWLRESTGLRDRARLVVGDRAAWDSVWRNLVGAGEGALGAPAVDFGRETVLVAAQGSSGWDERVEVRRAAVRGDTLFAVVHSTPPPYCVEIPDGEMRPAAVVRVPRHAGPVVFVEERDTLRCER